MEIPPWLTKEYLGEVLCKNYDDPGITVDNFEVSTTTKGDNYASMLHKVAVTYRDGEGNQGKKSLILKSLPENEIFQKLIVEMRCFEKETAAYSKLIPAMRSLTETPIVSPKFYATERASTVILEDLSDQGFKMADRKRRLNLAHSLVALKGLARFHGLSFAVEQKDPTIVDHFPQYIKSDSDKEADAKMLQKIDADLASVVETWPGYERFSEKILRRLDEIRIQADKIMLPKIGAFNVINHGDFWVNNMLFRYNEDTKEVDDVCLIDLQMAGYRSPAIDLQYFFTSSLEDGLREQHENMLLEVYHQAFAETLESLGMDSTIYSLSDLKNDFEEKAPYGFNVGTILLGVVVNDSSGGAIDFDSFGDESVSPIQKTIRGKEFRHAYQKHLIYYEKKGVI